MIVLTMSIKDRDGRVEFAEQHAAEALQEKVEELSGQLFDAMVPAATLVGLDPKDVQLVIVAKTKVYDVDVEVYDADVEITPSS